MRRWLLLSTTLLLTGLLAFGVYAQVGSIEDRTDSLSFVYGFWLGRERLSGMRRSSATGITIGGADVTSITTTTGTASRTMTVNGMQGVLPATQTIAAGGTIAADACGSLKRITSAGNVTTDLTNSLTDPTTVPGCLMIIRNVGAFVITIDRNALMLLVGAIDLPLAASSSITVVSDGVTWVQITAQLAAT